MEEDSEGENGVGLFASPSSSPPLLLNPLPPFSLPPSSSSLLLPEPAGPAQAVGPRAGCSWWRETGSQDDVWLLKRNDLVAGDAKKESSRCCRIKCDP
jgi:hypothetical protein